MQVRRAQAAELVEIGELTVAAYEPFLLGRTDPYADELRNAAARDHDAELWVAVDADRTLLGTVTICPEGSPMREVALADEGEFRMLAVAPAAQGQGVGRALVSHCLDRFREQGAPAAVLCSLDDMTRAHGLYASLGFERLPDRDWEPHPGTRLLAFRAVL